MPSTELQKRIVSAVIEAKTSKAGNGYKVLVLSFAAEDGRIYSMQVFLKEEQAYILEGLK